MPGTSPTVQRRRLGATLRALREARGLTGTQAGEAIERSPAWISRVESGRMGIRGRDLRDLLDLYRVFDEAKRSELHRLADEGRTRGWWSQHTKSIPEVYATLIGLESDASRLAIYESNVITGLLQTETYARHIIGSGLLPLEESVVEERVRIRLRRQQILTRKDPIELLLLSPEAVLDREVGSSLTMNEQLRHLANMAQQPNVDVRILENAHVPAVTAVANFVMIYFSAPDPEVVYVEDLTGGKLEEGDSVRPYQQVFSRFESRALSPNQSLERIQESEERFRNS